MKNAERTPLLDKAPHFLGVSAAFLSAVMFAAFRFHETLVKAIEKFALSE